MADDPYNLQRFVDAQEPVYEQVRRELANGRKLTHWMWFIFPQISGLGRSPTAELYAISSKREAEAYLKHPVLGPRLRECTNLVTAVQARSLHDIFGNPDDLKFCSSMTLFAHATPDSRIFFEALRKYCQGRFDMFTMQKL